MSDYTTYTNYAKKAIDELQQLANFKKSLKGKKLADKIREAGLKLITKSGVDSILHGLGESNGFQNLTPAQKQIAEKLVSLKDTALTHKSSSIQGVLDENAEMAQSDITKIIDYSEKLQSMFTVNDNLEDWVKAKLNHACDYVATVRDYLKFYNEEKQKGTQNIEEKWSNTYKKSIDCGNAKGFSQKAHCRARQLRKDGKSTQSKPVKESYKEAVQELLKEQNSSMAMGALKQLNSDAKELETMLQPNTQLEDWVKAKLNLAGEYLDDVYHHLDHFGAEGRQFDENYYTDKEKRSLERGLRWSATTTPREKKYWFTPSGTVADAGLSHEDWIKQNDPSLVGTTLVGTYDNAIKKGYIRAVVQHGFLMLSNLENSDFSMNGNTSQNVPAVKLIVLDAIKNFIAEKNIQITASGRGGNIIKDLSSDDPNLTENWKKNLATAALAASTMFGTPNVQADKVKGKVPVSVKTVSKPSAPKVDTMAVFNKYSSIHPDFPKFLNAIHKVESSGQITGTEPIIGDKGKARGPLQIHREYWADVKNLVGGKYEDVDNLDYASNVVAKYMLKYAKNAIKNGQFDIAAKRHNGGPNGDKKSATYEYARKVMSKMPTEYVMVKKENVNGSTTV